MRDQTHELAFRDEFAWGINCKPSRGLHLRNEETLEALHYLEPLGSENQPR